MRWRSWRASASSRSCASWPLRSRTAWATVWRERASHDHRAGSPGSGGPRRLGVWRILGERSALGPLSSRLIGGLPGSGPGGSLGNPLRNWRPGLGLERTSVPRARHCCEGADFMSPGTPQIRSLMEIPISSSDFGADFRAALTPDFGPPCGDPRVDLWLAPSRADRQIVPNGCPCKDTPSRGSRHICPLWSH